jgi:hypothetical protein
MANNATAAAMHFVNGTFGGKGQIGVNEKVLHGVLAVATLADNQIIGLAVLNASAEISAIHLGSPVPAAALNVDVNVGIYDLTRTAAATPGTVITEAGGDCEDLIVDGLTINATSFNTNAAWTGTNALNRGTKLWEVHDSVRTVATTRPDPDFGQYELAITVEDAAVADGTGDLHFLIRYVEP